MFCEDFEWGRPLACGGLLGRLQRRPAGPRAPRRPRACPTESATYHALLFGAGGIGLGETVALIGHGEGAVGADGHLKVVAMIDLINIGEELLGRIMVRAARRRAMDLPEVQKPRRLVDDLPVLGV